jgi:16S rRNA U516 pseudouridylate synthase RsuA-like enzyme
MLRVVGHRVRRLLRVAIGRYKLGDLPAGRTRELQEVEVLLLAQDQSGRSPRSHRPA